MISRLNDLNRLMSCLKSIEREMMAALLRDMAAKVLRDEVGVVD